MKAKEKRKVEREGSRGREARIGKAMREKTVFQ